MGKIIQRVRERQERTAVVRNRPRADLQWTDEEIKSSKTRMADAYKNFNVVQSQQSRLLSLLVNGSGWPKPKGADV